MNKKPQRDPRTVGRSFISSGAVVVAKNETLDSDMNCKKKSVINAHKMVTF